MSKIIRDIVTHMLNLSNVQVQYKKSKPNIVQKNIKLSIIRNNKHKHNKNNILNQINTQKTKSNEIEKIITESDKTKEIQLTLFMFNQICASQTQVERGAIKFERAVERKRLCMRDCEKEN
jgi:hypothetical protein